MENEEGIENYDVKPNGKNWRTPSQKSEYVKELH